MSVAPVARPAYSQETALIVNSQSKEREALRRFFTGAEYHVLVAESGTKAVELCRNYEGAIHIMVTDVALPGLSGWKLAEKVSKIRPGMIVLFLSAEYLEGGGSIAPVKKPAGSLTTTSSVTPGMLVQVTQALRKTADASKRFN